MKYLFFVFLAILLVCSLGMGQIPQLMSHQGYVADSTGTGITGTLPMTFRMYDDSTLVLTQAFPSVGLTKGIFNVNLDVSSLSFSSQYWLETEVNSQTLAPRTRLTSAPYSLAPWGTNGSNVYYNNGNVGIGTTAPNAKLDVRGDVLVGNMDAPDIGAGEGNLHIENTAGDSKNSFRIDGYGNNLSIIGRSKTGASVGTGIEFRTAPAEGIESPRMYINSDGKVGIGTKSPGATLDVAGNVKIADGSQGAGKVLTSDASGVASWQQSGAHTIGESYGGGIVFYVDATGQHGLIAATADQGTGIQWYNGSYTTTNATRDGIGAGMYNTQLIISNQGAGSYAAKICAGYQGGGYGDWYLPSKYELNLLYLQKAVVGGFSSVYYWSSTENLNISVWDQLFLNGLQVSSSKSSPGYVRAVRAF